MTRIFTEENRKYQLDCSKAIWATDEIHSEYSAAKISLLSDVDFLIETEKEYIFIEYKNASIEGASHPEAFKPSDDKVIKKIARKYYDSLFYFWLLRRDIKPFDYVFILEYPDGDKATRKLVRDKISNYLPYTLQCRLKNPDRLIRNFEVLSVEEWNKRYPEIPLALVDLGKSEGSDLHN